jgi:hypothetical protein
VRFIAAQGWRVNIMNIGSLIAMLESSLPYTSPTQIEGAGAMSGLSAVGPGVFRDEENHTSFYAEDENRGDLRILICLCAASAAVSLSALYFIVSKLNLI